MFLHAENFRIKRWKFSLEGSVCPCCDGKGERLEGGNLHISAGWVPCDLKYTQGHGYPRCGEDNKLHFSEYDRKNRKCLMEKYK